MNAPPGPVGIAIVGPTASGKTALSLEVAARLHGEVVSMDSRQVYCGMDVGTAKVTPAERGSVPHHGLDLVDPDERYSAGRFARDARRWIDEIIERGAVPVLVGGTGFFLRALTEPLFREPTMEPSVRRRLEAFLGALPAAERARWLRRLDPAIAARLEQGGGSQRSKRALEVVLLTGRPLSWWHSNATGEPGVSLLVFVVEVAREELDRRIDQRVTEMLAAGLVEEVRGLLDAGYAEDAPGMSATGYRQIVSYLRGAVSLEDAAEAIRHETRRYARRQLTWNRNQLPENAVALDGTRPMSGLADMVIREWNQAATHEPRTTNHESR